MRKRASTRCGTPDRSLRRVHARRPQLTLPPAATAAHVPSLARDDFTEREIEAERLDGGGRSRVAVRIANVLSHTVLKIFSLQERHENKDAYDMVFALLKHEGGPRAAGGAAVASPGRRPRAGR